MKPAPTNSQLAGVMDFEEFQKLTLASPFFHDWLRRGLILAYNDAQLNPLLGTDNLIVETILSMRSQSVGHIPLALRVLIDAPKQGVASEQQLDATGAQQDTASLPETRV